jgi:hypothetical protein
MASASASGWAWPKSIRRRGPFQMVGFQTQRRADENEAENPVGVIGGQAERLHNSLREASQHGVIGTGGVHDRQGLSTTAATPYAFGSRLRSERPLPGPSKVITRKGRARYGTCSFQKRLWTIVQAGSSSRVGAPSPNTS